MSVKAFDYISATVTEESKRKVPARIDALFAKAGVSVPQDGSKIPIGDVDEALKGQSIEVRLEIKSQLRALALID